MTEDLNSLLNACLDGRLTRAQNATLLKRLKRPEVAARLERLRGLRIQLHAALPRPTKEQSRRMWSAISAQLPVRVQATAPTFASTVPRSDFVEAGSRSIPGPWYAFFSRPWVPTWGLGLAGAMAALVWVFLAFPRPTSSPSPFASPLEMSRARARPSGAVAGVRVGATSYRPMSVATVASPTRPVYASAVPKREVGSAPILPAAPAPAAPAEELAGLPSASTSLSTPSSAVSNGPTEVERALADNQVDSMIQQFLAARPQASVPVVAMLAPSPDVRSSGLGGRGEDTVAYQQESAPALQDMSAGVPGIAKGGTDDNGYWDWNSAAESLNQGDWRQARVELRTAAAKAGSAAERDFADSALGLLSVPGAPLEGMQTLPPSMDDLRVLSAGTWQLLVGSRLARFSQGVNVRLPGLREAGDSFLLDLTFNRGEFAPGSHFVRVSGETPARVLDLSGKPVTADDFYAPSGADYSLPNRELRLR